MRVNSKLRVHILLYKIWYTRFYSGLGTAHALSIDKKRKLAVVASFSFLHFPPLFPKFSNYKEINYQL